MRTVVSWSAYRVALMVKAIDRILEAPMAGAFLEKRPQFRLVRAEIPQECRFRRTIVHGALSWTGWIPIISQ
jgi:hypothetical protein